MEKRRSTLLKKFLLPSFVSVFLLILSLQNLYAQRIVGYYPYYRTFATVSPNIRWTCLTDVFYAFATVDASGNLTIQGSGNFSSVKGQCKPINASGPNLWLSIGGAGQSGNFNTVATNATARANFVSQCRSLAATHNLKGIDVDWEFPTTAQATNHQLLMTDLTTGMHADGRLTCMAVGGEYNAAIASPTHLDYCTATTLGIVDYVNVMTYDFPAGYGADHSGVTISEASVTAWKNKAGSTYSKFLIGIPFYGRPNPRGSNVTQDYNVETNYTTAYASGLASGYYYNSKTMMETKIDWIMTQGGSGVLIWDLGQDRAAPYNYQDAICARMATACPAPQPALGADFGICMPGTITVNSGVATASGRTFAWKVDGVTDGTQTSPTYSKATTGFSAGNHTFECIVTQSSCSRSDIVTVNLANPVTATGGTRCGTGTVNLNVTSTGGTYEWYNAATGGTLLFTGSSFTTPSISTTTDYYVQQATGSSTYYAGRPSTVIGNCWNEFASDANPGTKAAHAHKMTVSSSLTIQSVDIYTDGTALSNARIVAYSSLDGSTVIKQSSAVNIPAMTAGTAYTFPCNLALDPGTYFVGIFVPNTSTGNAHVWLDITNTATPFAQAGVYSIEGNTYDGNFVAAQTPNHYGQLFNWVIVSGITPPCGRTTVTATVTTGATPTPGTITGSATPCAGSSGNAYSIAAVSGATSYTWTYSGTGATITGGTTTNATIAFSAGATSGTLSVTATGSCGTSTASTKTITISSAMTAPGTITGSATPCVNSSGNAYSIAAVSGATSYTWTYSGTGATITGGTTTNATIAFTAGATSGTLSVTATGPCGTSTASTKALTMSTAPTTPGTITGGATVCAGTSGNAYSIAAVAGATSYTWAYTGTGATITGGTTTNATVAFAAGATSGNLTVTATNACGTSTARTKAITISGAMTAPGAITGSASVCAPTSGAYSITAVAGATSYTWTYSGTGATITGGTTINATVAFAAGATSGTLSVTATGTCGTSTASTKTITVSATPATPGAIAGSVSACAGSSGNAYSISAVAGAASYTWAYSGTGATITGGSTTNATVAFSAGATAGNLTVTATNSCGTSAAQTQALTINSAPTAPGSISGSAAVTQSSSGNAYSISSIAGATSYTWAYSGTGATITGGTTTNATVAFNSTATSGNLSVTASNACGTSSASTLAITVSPATAITFSGNDKLEAYVKPNPFDTDGQLVITAPKNMIINAVLYDVIGNEKAVIIRNQSITQGEHTYSIPDYLSPGMYVLRIEGDKQVQTIRIIKTK